MAVNLYPGPCTACGEIVGARQGTRNKVDGRWTVAHLDGECGTATAAPTTRTTTYPPTAEQQVCIDLFATGDSMVIKAGAGTGKTSTLRMIAESAPTKRVQYVAFNKSIVVDVAGSMPANVKASTAHSLAFQAIGKQYGSRLKSARMRSTELARLLGLDRFACRVNDRNKVLSEEQLAGHVMRAISNFCKTADEKPSVRNFPVIDSILSINVDGSTNYSNNDRLAETLLPIVERAWVDIAKVDGRLPFKHDHYLKLWQLSHPTINADVILFDEAQDANPVMAAVIAEQTHAQRVYVGDSNQAIYEFTGAVNALDSIDTDHVAMLTKSFRFGPAIAAAANEILAELESDMRLIGHDPIGSTVGPLEGRTADAILTRTNAAAVDAVLNAMDAGQRPYLVGGGDEVVRFAKAARDLQEGRSTEHPELSCFDSWGEVVQFVQQDSQGDELALLVRLVDTYGVPTILRALDRMPTEDDADVIISTAHKAKGREWDTVQIAGDFVKEVKPGEIPEPPSASELRLRYVAVTRAKQHLDHTALTDPAPSPEGAVEAPRMGDRWADQHGVQS